VYILEKEYIDSMAELLMRELLSPVLGYIPVSLTPFQNNLAATTCMVLYGKVALEMIAWLRQRFFLPAHITKQLVYLTISFSVIFWSLFDTSDWSWRLNAVFPTAMLVRFLYKVSKYIVLLLLSSVAAGNLALFVVLWFHPVVISKVLPQTTTHQRDCIFVS
jgi:hypothetical protein